MSRMRARRLSTLAKVIQKLWPDLRVELGAGYCNTDRKPRGARYRMPGKGRTGARLQVFSGSARILDHNAAETYRDNMEVAHWVEDRAQRRVPEVWVK